LGGFGSDLRAKGLDWASERLIADRGCSGDARGLSNLPVIATFTNPPAERAKAFQSEGKESAPIIRRRIKGRNTVTRRRFVGGVSLKILSARVPRIRDGTILNACWPTNATGLSGIGCSKRAFAHADHKIVQGSTPAEEDVLVLNQYCSEPLKIVFPIPSG
jgi:hypothetical protein